MPNAMEEGPSVSVRAANYEFKGKIIALGWPVARSAVAAAAAAIVRRSQTH